MGTLYTIYFIISIWLTIIVGNSLHRHGRHWIHYLLEDEAMADRLNDLLLLAYRLLNVGYILYSLYGDHENKIGIVFLCNRLATIALTLAFLHYQNIVGILIFSHYKNKHKWQT
jgi:hypothetical protein